MSPPATGPLSRYQIKAHMKDMKFMKNMKKSF